MDTKSIQLTLSEVARHNKPGDIWIVNEDKVYDVSIFVAKHPGGSKVLLNHGGEDVTTLLQSKPHKHSPNAYTLLRKYFIGCVGDTLGPENFDKNGKPKRRGHIIDGDAAQVGKLGDWESDNLIDWNSPMFWQIGKLGDKYWDWIHAPVDRHIRLFKSDFGELLTCAPWWLIPLVWVPTLSLFFWRGLVKLGQQDTYLPVFWNEQGVLITPAMSPLLILSGYCLWQIIEYIIHRWIFHRRPHGYYSIMVHFAMHGLHHKDPLNKNRLVFPPVPAMAFAIPILLLFTCMIPVAIGYCILAGVGVGYVMYDMMHYYLHHGSPFIKLMGYLKQYHMRHHFEDANLGFGITTPILDFPFGTQLPPLKKTD